MLTRNSGAIEERRQASKPNRVARRFHDPGRLDDCVASHFGRTMPTIFDLNVSVTWPKKDYATLSTSISVKPR